jgi:hypothetical protein
MISGMTCRLAHLISPLKGLTMDWAPTCGLAASNASFQLVTNSNYPIKPAKNEIVKCNYHS